VKLIKTLSYHFFDVLPTALQNFLRGRKRALRRKTVKKTAASILDGELFPALRELLLEETTPIMIHASAEFLNNAGVGLGEFNQLILESSHRRTVLMPTFPFEGLALHGLKELAFDPKRTPSKMGIQTEIFRRSPGVERSIHPTHPLAAIGKLSKVLLADHHKSVLPFDSKSPFGKLDLFDGQILLVGVGLEVLTHVHVAEDYLGRGFPFPPYLPEVFRVAISNSKPEMFVETMVHNPKFSRLKNIGKLRSFFLQNNALEERYVGGVIALQILNAPKTTETIIDLARRGITIYD